MCRKLGKGYLFADGSVFVEDAFPKFIEAEPASALPVHGLRYAALFTIDNFLKTGNAVCYRVFSHFYADVAAAHFMGHGRRGAGTEEGIQNQIAGIRRDI